MIKKYHVISVLTVAFVMVIFVFVGRRAPLKSETISHVSAQNQTQIIATSTPSEITHGNTSKKQVIFTFDGGGSVQSGDQILSVLSKHKVKGTFFLTGKFVEANPDFVKRIVTGGNEIFNHTYDHKDLTTLSGAEIAQELTKMENALQTIAGISPKPYFRAPYGTRDAKVLSVAARNGYQSVYWTKDALDWEAIKGETASQVKERILSSIAPGNIYLMHIGDTITGEILSDVFSSIKVKGYKIVSLTQGM